MEITFFQGLWFLLIFVLIAGYFVLDGFDLGAGVLYPFVAKGDEEKAVVRTSIGPVWDGNEVWLLTAGGHSAVGPHHPVHAAVRPAGPVDVPGARGVLAGAQGAEA